MFASLAAYRSLRFYSLCRECLIDKAAIIEFLDQARVVELIEVHSADFWILRFHQALHMDHAFDRRKWLALQDAQQVKIAFFGPRGIDFHAPHQCFDRRRLVLGCHDVGYRFDFSLEQVLQRVAALLQKTSLYHQSLAEELMLEIGVFADNRESLGFDSARVDAVQDRSIDPGFRSREIRGKKLGTVRS